MYFLICYTFSIGSFQFSFDTSSVYKERRSDVITGDGWQIVCLYVLYNSKKNSGNLIGLHLSHLRLDWPTINASGTLLIYATKIILAMIVKAKLAQVDRLTEVFVSRHAFSFYEMDVFQ